jgi:hypothetical protein
MKTRELQQFVDRTPFRRFSVRLSNGKLYQFEKPKDVGASKDFHRLVYFDESGAVVLIDAENIVEIIDEPGRK